MVKKDKTIYEENCLLTLLRKEPSYESNVEENEEWNEKVKEAVNYLLGFYEESERIEIVIEELKQEVKDLSNRLERHKHLKDGTAVGRI